MEEAIRFRLCVNQLDDKEFDVFLNKVGRDQIISVMLAGFLYMHQNQTKPVNAAKNINNIISTIITSRDPETDESNDTNISNNTLTLNTLPSEMIRECASYLNVIDYLDFALCDGLIYVACNSPPSLQKLDMTYHGYPPNLNKFTLLGKICINPSGFNRRYDNINISVLHNIKSLTIDMEESNNHSELEAFINTKCINLTQIQQLKCKSFGATDVLYNFDAFCDFMKQFPNVTKLIINGIYFTDFKDNDVAELLPKLKILYFFDSQDMNANCLRDKLIETHSKQIIRLLYDGGVKDININSLQALNLKELTAISPCIQSLYDLIKINVKLESVCINVTSNDIDANAEKWSKVMCSLFTKCRELTVIQLVMCMNQFENIIKLSEIGLGDSDDMERDFIKIIYDVYCDESSMNDIGLYLKRIINAVSLCSTEHFMIIFTFYADAETIIVVNEKLNFVKKLKKQYLIFEETGNDDKYLKIIVSNKNNS